MTSMLHHCICPPLIVCFLAATFPFHVGASPQREQSRSMVVSQYGLVATSQAVASQAGAAILAKGGNAIDAAIAANAALGVIEPMMNGMGGDLFAIVYDAKTKKLYGLNSSGWAPKNMTAERLRAKGLKAVPSSGIESVTVPGAVAGWDALHKRWGKLSLSEDLAPAASLAEKGIAVPETDAENWAHDGARFAGNPAFAHVYWPDGKAPAMGQIFRNPELAASLRLVGEKGRDGFYKGRIAESILKLSNELGGTMQAGDLADFQPEWVDPISTTYHGWTVYEIPPNGQGIAALTMLNIMENFPLAEWGHNSVKTLHTDIEAKKLAYADLLQYVGDMRASHVPVEQLLSKDLAAKRAKLITDKAQCHVLPSDINQQLARLASDTTYFTAIDHEGNQVSMIQSNSANFGSGLVADNTGFALQNRAAGFNLLPGAPNMLRPHMRPLHTIIPGFMIKGDQRISFGIMSGWNQAQAHAQFVSNIVDFHMNVQAALEAARFTKLTFDGCDVTMENGIPPDVIEALRAKGHDIKVELRYSQTMGRGNAILHDDTTGVNFGGTDPRTDGEVVPEMPPF